MRDIIDDPEALQRFKKKHYKYEKNTLDIDNLIHKAIVKKKEKKRNAGVEQMKVVEVNFQQRISESRELL